MCRAPAPRAAHPHFGVAGLDPTAADSRRRVGQSGARSQKPFPPGVLLARGRYRIVLGLLFALLGASSGPGSREAAAAAGADSLEAAPAGPSVSVSYWGALPADTDSSTLAHPRNNRMPLWEGAVVYPWRVATYPIKLATQGLGAGIVALDEGGAIKTLAHLLAPPPTIVGFIPSATAGGAAGFGIGGGIYDKHFLTPRCEAEIRYQGTFSGGHKSSLGFRIDGGTPREVDLVIGYRYRPYARYYGLGPNSRPEEETIYAHQIGWVGGSYRHALGRGVVGEVELLGSQILAGGTDFDLTDGVHYLPDVFNGARLPDGYRQNSRGASLALSLAHDTTTETGRPERGGLRRATASWFESFGKLDADFWTFRVEAQQFVPLWFSQRALALRGFVSYIDPTGSDPVPFQRLNYNDTPDNLRGYSEYRFRDRGMAVASAEYRWPVWADRTADGPGLDMYLLTDVGQVFGNFHQLTLPNLTVSYGGGLRFVGGDHGLSLRLEMAKSREETQFRFRADQVFQFMKESLFYGRNPVPSR